MDCLFETGWEGWTECRGVLFEPAEWAGYDYFVEDVVCSCGCCYGYLVLCLGLVVARWCFDACDGFVEADVGFCGGGYGDVF